MELSVKLKQVQKHSLKPSMINSLNILKMNSNDLEDYVKNEIENNPFIQIDETFYSNYNNLELFDNIADQKSVLDDLFMQLNTTKKVNKQIGQLILNSVDEKGFLDLDNKQIIKLVKCTKKELIQTLDSIKHFYPNGVGCKDVSDFLLFQLKGKYEIKTLKSIISMLPDLVAKKYNKVAKTCNCSQSLVIEIFDNIKKCNPYPINLSVKTQFIRPDVFIFIENDTIKIIIKDITQFLSFDKVDIKINDKQTQDYLNKFNQSYSLLHKNCQHRSDTLNKIMNYIIIKQKDFFISNQDLQPMILKEIADHLALNQSTIQRAISNKYYQFNNKTYSIKSLFSQKASCDLSTQAIKNRLISLIEQEDKNIPLSDAQIIKHFSYDDILISRRTISKYRNSLNIGNSLQRKIN